MRSWRRQRIGLAGGGVCAVAAILAGELSPARAFDLSSLDVFNLFGSKDKPPPVSAAAISYELRFELGDAPDAGTLKRSLQDASLLYRLRDDAPPDGETLARRAAADINPLIDALWAQGYFNAQVAIAVDGVAVTEAGEPPPGLARAAERYRNRAPAPVVVTVDPGPLFALRNVDIVPAGRRDPAAVIPIPARSRASCPGRPPPPPRSGPPRPRWSTIGATSRARSPASSRSARWSTMPRGRWMSRSSSIPAPWPASATSR